MTALNSGLHFLSGLALHFGNLPVWNSEKAIRREQKRRLRAADYNYTPLTERQKRELLESIREDDWFE